MATQTTNLGLTKPAVGQIGWGDAVNANFDAIDTAITNAAVLTDTTTGQKYKLVVTDGELSITPVS